MKASDLLCCINCKGKLETEKRGMYCGRCKISFALEDGVYDFNKKNDRLVEEYQKFQAKSDPYNFIRAPKIIIEGHERKREILKHFFDEYDVKGKKILDVGSGEGIPPLLKGCRLGIIQDISKNTLKKSQKSAAKEGIADKFIFISCKEDLPVSSDSLDLVFAGEIIEHVEDPSKFLRELFRVLKPHGKMVLTTPNSKAIIFRILGFKYSKGPQHISLQDYGSLMVILRKKFKVKNVYGFNQTFFHYLDNIIKNEKICRWWAKLFFERPKYAANLVVICEKS